jgi:hypothetical protein
MLKVVLDCCDATCHRQASETETKEMDIGLVVRSPLEVLELPSREVSTLLRYLSLTQGQRAALVPAELHEVIATAHRATARLVEKLKSARLRGARPESVGRAAAALREVLETVLEPAQRAVLDETARKRIEWFCQLDDWERYVELAAYAEISRPAGVLLGHTPLLEERTASLLTRFANVLVFALRRHLEPFRQRRYAEPALMDVLVSTTAFLRNGATRAVFCSASGEVAWTDRSSPERLSPNERPAALASSISGSPATGISALTAYLEQPAAAPVEVIYQVLFSLWLLSFAVRNIGPKPFEGGQVPLRLSGVLRELRAEKVVRLAVAILRNLSEDATLCREMIGAGVATYVAMGDSALRRLRDEEMQSDMGYLRARLAEQLSSMSSFEMYVEEVMIGSLDWTPPHRDASFWEEHATRLESDNWQVLRRLCALVRASEDPQILSIAMNDICEILRVQPRSRGVLEGEKIKSRLLALLTHQNGEVKRRALSCVQRLILSVPSLGRTVH